MDKDKALLVVLEAARNWHAELNTYIIPGVSAEEAAGYQAQADELERALDQFN